jgi:hypothetical protein
MLVLFAVHNRENWSLYKCMYYGTRHILDNGFEFSTIIVFSWSNVSMIFVLRLIGWGQWLGHHYPHVGGGVRKSDRIPNTRFHSEGMKVRTREGTKNPRKSVSASKDVNPFTRALEPPFIGRRRDFYIPRLPSNLKNIRGVNMYMNVFYISWFTGLISHNYKPATYSHLKPRLLAPPFDSAHSWLPLHIREDF